MPTLSKISGNKSFVCEDGTNDPIKGEFSSAIFTPRYFKSIQDVETADITTLARMLANPDGKKPLLLSWNLSDVVPCDDPREAWKNPTETLPRGYKQVSVGVDYESLLDVPQEILSSVLSAIMKTIRPNQTTPEDSDPSSFGG